MTSSKLRMSAKSTAAGVDSIGLENSKLLMLQGESSARSVKVGVPPEPPAPVLDASRILELKGGQCTGSVKVSVIQPPAPRAALS